MASSDTTHRAVLAGLSCGIGMATPVVLYTATLPFSRVNETVAAGAIPFAAGAVAGVGIMCASMAISERRQRQDGEGVFSPFGNMADGLDTESDFSTAELPIADRAKPSRSVHAEVPINPFAAAVAASAAEGTPAPTLPTIDPEPSKAASSEAKSGSPSVTSSLIAGITGALQRRRSLDDVPQITRAAGAPSEEEAWAMIDSMLDEGSPVSCDPARSRDVYQVAIDEMRAGAAQTGSVNREDIEAAARAVAGSRTAPAGTTATFVALVANAAAQTAQTPAPTVEVEPESVVPMVDDEEVEAAKQAAVDSLWGAPAAPMGPGVQSVPYNDALASLPVLSAEDGGAAKVSAASSPAASVSPVANASGTASAAGAQTSATVQAAREGVDLTTQQIGAPSPEVTAHVASAPRIDTEDLPDGMLEDDVPMADYSGHEDMWAAALSILDDDEPAAELAEALATPVSTAADEPAYVGRHAQTLPDDTARLSRKSLERAGAIAEGVLANRRHARVNQIFEEEAFRIDPASARRRDHEYLSVIEGGTSSFKPLKQEA